ncbi:hypothetical protein VNO77_01215 [Canavalia gladiata]|uniref:Uncharacterized protein n=1 Tax=Canavalia gladiata TaxID=3824 RepID=A0AAN9MRH3_CANGL
MDKTRVIQVVTRKNNNTLKLWAREEFKIETPSPFSNGDKDQTETEIEIASLTTAIVGNWHHHSLTIATMASERSHVFVIAIFTTLLCFAVCEAKESVYELLPKYGLPSGLLPNTVTDYTLGEDGRFVVVLDKPCYVQFDYLVYYDTKISGKLNYGSITNLKGIQVQRFFLWLNVDEIRVDLPPSNNIYFQVGIINKKLNVDQFKTVRSCRNSLLSSPFHPRPIQHEVPMLLTE